MPLWLQDVLWYGAIIALFAAAYYSFLVVPRQREYKRRMQVVQELKIGTDVLTYGGIIGTIRKIDYDTGIVTIEVAPNLQLRFIAAAITQEFDAKAYAEAAKKHMK